MSIEAYERGYNTGLLQGRTQGAAEERERIRVKEKNEAWGRGRQFERNRVSAIIKVEIDYMESNQEGYEPAEIARYKRLLEFINNTVPEYKKTLQPNTVTQPEILVFDEDEGEVE